MQSNIDTAGLNETSSHNHHDPKKFIPPPLGSTFPHLAPSALSSNSSSSSSTHLPGNPLLGGGYASLSTNLNNASLPSHHSLYTTNPPPSGSSGSTASKHIFTPDQDSTILNSKKLGKTWNDIAIELRCDSPNTVIERYQYLISPEHSTSTSSSINHTFNSISNYTSNSNGSTVVNDSVNASSSSLGPPHGQSMHQIADITHWDDDDVETLRELLELGERAKWKYISTELTRERNKRIPAVACQKKFKDMFGVAEASSALGSSLCYVVSPNGWACLGDSGTGSSNTRAVPPSSSSVMYDYSGFNQQQQQAPSSMLPYQTQPPGPYGPLTTPSGFVLGSTSNLPPPAPVGSASANNTNNSDNNNTNSSDNNTTTTAKSNSNSSASTKNTKKKDMSPVSSKLNWSSSSWIFFFSRSIRWRGKKKKNRGLLLLRRYVARRVSFGIYYF